MFRLVAHYDSNAAPLPSASVSGAAARLYASVRDLSAVSKRPVGHKETGVECCNCIFWGRSSADQSSLVVPLVAIVSGRLSGKLEGVSLGFSSAGDLVS